MTGRPVSATTSVQESPFTARLLNGIWTVSGLFDIKILKDEKLF